MEEQRKSAWATYRKWRKVFWCAIPVGALVLAAAGGATWAAVVVFVPLFVCSSWFHFFFKTGYHPWEKHCLHCGFPKWAEPDPGSGPPARKD